MSNGLVPMPGFTFFPHFLPRIFAQDFVRRGNVRFFSYRASVPPPSTVTWSSAFRPRGGVIEIAHIVLIISLDYNKSIFETFSPCDLWIFFLEHLEVEGPDWDMSFIQWFWIESENPKKGYKMYLFRVSNLKKMLEMTPNRCQLITSESNLPFFFTKWKSDQNLIF